MDGLPRSVILPRTQLASGPEAIAVTCLLVAAGLVIVAAAQCVHAERWRTDAARSTDNIDACVIAILSHSPRYMTNMKAALTLFCLVCCMLMAIVSASRPKPRKHEMHQHSMLRIACQSATTDRSAPNCLHISDMITCS